MTVRVNFTGICTHLWFDEAHPRVVLVNATEARSIKGQPVGAHVPTLRIAAKDLKGHDPHAWPGTGDAILEWPLIGVRMSINATGKIERDDSYLRCMPSLQKLAPSIGPPAAECVTDENPRLSSCYFDITGGTLVAGTIKEGGAVISQLVAETEEPPVLSISAFGSEVPELIPLADGAEITIANLGRNEREDGHFDFYLHYTLAATMVDELKVPDPTDAKCRLIGHSATLPPGLVTVDAGCSNSTYP